MVHQPSEFKISVAQKNSLTDYHTGSVSHQCRWGITYTTSIEAVGVARASQLTGPFLFRLVLHSAFPLNWFYVKLEIPVYSVINSQLEDKYSQLPKVICAKNKRNDLSWNLNSAHKSQSFCYKTICQIISLRDYITSKNMKKKKVNLEYRDIDKISNHKKENSVN